MNKKWEQKQISVYKWLRRTFVRISIVPIAAIIAAVFILNAFVSSYLSTTMSNDAKSQSNSRLKQVVKDQAQIVQEKLTSVRVMTEVYRQQTFYALQSPAAFDTADAARLAYSPEGAYYTTADRPEGGAAVFYTGYHPVGAVERSKAARVLTTQMMMKSIQQSNPLIASLYLNTFDSLNVIYPYFDVISQFAIHTDVTTYNFYYEADEKQNPNREVRWTGAYLDPAGHGWMISCIAPVYTGNFLEGVVGIDITVGTIANDVLQIQLPWKGYCMLVDSAGTIMALPRQGEDSWGLKELTDHHYDDAIMSDTFKPEEFNIGLTHNLKDFAEALKNSRSGVSEIMLKGEADLVAWDTVAETGWRLLVVVPKSEVYQNVSAVENNMGRLGIVVLLIAFVLFSLFLFFLSRQATTTSRYIAKRLSHLTDMVKSIGKGDYYQPDPQFPVTEIQETVESIVDMGRQLGDNNKDLLETQKMLRQREMDLHAVVNSTDDIIMEINRDGMIQNIWAKNQDNLSVKYDPASETTIYSVLDGEMARKAMKTVYTAFATGQPQFLEYQLETNRGLRWFSARMEQPAGQSEKLVVAARDITHRKEMENSLIAAKEEAESANRAKTEFLSHMSHELRTPLNAVLGFSQLLQTDRSAPLNEDQQESVGEIIKAGGHLLELINEVLDLAKIETGKISLSIEPVNVCEIVDECLMLLKPMADMKNIEIVRDSGTGVNYVMADALRIKQIIINLMSNAIKYNREKGTVYLSCLQQEDSILFEVTDTGYGISEEDLKTIFEPFHRLNATKNTVEGTGIGLAVVSRLISLMNGKVQVKSTEGVGSTFIISFPRAEGPQPIDESILDAIPAQSYQGETRKVLYIEDNPANLNLVRHIVSRIPGVIFLSTVQGTLGIDLAKSHIPALIMVDIDLPDIDGYEVLARLKAAEETKDIPVIAISASAMKKDIEKGKARGFSQYITKPIDTVNLIRVIQSYLNLL